MNFNTIKKMLTLTFVCCFIASLITVLITNLNYQKYITENNKAILNMVSIVLENDSIEKEDIIHAIENADKKSLEVLEEYGYNLDTEFFIGNNELNLRSNILINLAVVNALVILVMCIFYLILKIREKRINKLILYLQKLQEKNYTLEIDENQEHELSKLQNEIYKITILLKEQAENSYKDKVQIKNNIVDISHQLKTPLTSMSIMTENILDYPNMDEQTRLIFLKNINERIAHTEILVQNLLKLSRFDANVIEFKKENINVYNLIKNSMEKNRILMEQKEISININCQDNISLIGDFAWQSEAISNIIKNAIEHSFTNSKIEINCSENNFAVKISIKDFGVGIKKENISKIFTRYYKDENSSENSLGVGLNLAKTIIDKDQGVIKVSSKENEYTIFEIRYIK